MFLFLIIIFLNIILENYMSSSSHALHSLCLRLQDNSNDKRQKKNTMENLKIDNLKKQTIENFDEDDIGFLTLEQISRFKQNHIEAFTPEQIYWFSVKQVQAFTPKQISWFTVKQIQAFTSIQIYCFTENQIQALIQNQIQDLNPYHIKALTGEQIQAFTANQIEAFSLDQISWIPAEKIIFFGNNIKHMKQNSLDKDQIKPFLESYHLMKIIPINALILRTSTTLPLLLRPLIKIKNHTKLIQHKSFLYLIPITSITASLLFILKKIKNNNDFKSTFLKKE